MLLDFFINSLSILFQSLFKELQVLEETRKASESEVHNLQRAGKDNRHKIEDVR